MRDSLKILYYVFIFYSLAKRLAIPSSHFATRRKGIFGISAAPFFLCLYLFYFILKNVEECSCFAAVHLHVVEL